MAATAALLLAIFCLGIDLYVVAALIPTMADDLGEPVAALGLLVSAYALPNALLAPVFGPLSDRLGRRLAMPPRLSSPRRSAGPGRIATADQLAGGGRR